MWKVVSQRRDTLIMKPNISVLLCNYFPCVMLVVVPESHADHYRRNYANERFEIHTNFIVELTSVLT